MSIGKDALNLSQFWKFGRDLVELSADLVRSGRVETGALSVNIFWSGRVWTGQAISQSSQVGSGRALFFNTQKM